MKEGIHPKYQDVTISCACGSVATVRSTAESLHVDICSKCHPYYTGKKQQILDRGGRIQQFNKRYGRTEQASEAEPAAELAAEAAAKA